jgi:hypothetical protein
MESRGHTQWAKVRSVRRQKVVRALSRERSFGGDGCLIPWQLCWRYSNRTIPGPVKAASRIHGADAAKLVQPLGLACRRLAVRQRVDAPFAGMEVVEDDVPDESGPAVFRRPPEQHRLTSRSLPKYSPMEERHCCWRDRRCDDYFGTVRGGSAEPSP